MDDNNRSPIKKYVTEMIQNIIGNANSFGDINNPTIVGTLRELLVSDLFEKLMIQDFGVGTGKIINQKEQLSHQIDIIIYDKRILPPLIEYNNLGIFPAESVLGIIEVKSTLSKNEIIKTSKSNERLIRSNYIRESSLYKDLPRLFPLTSICGFYNGLPFKYENTVENRQEIAYWMNKMPQSCGLLVCWVSFLGCA